MARKVFRSSRVVPLVTTISMAVLVLLAVVGSRSIGFMLAWVACLSAAALGLTLFQWVNCAHSFIAVSDEGLSARFTKSPLSAVFCLPPWLCPKRRLVHWGDIAEVALVKLSITRPGFVRALRVRERQARGRPEYCLDYHSLGDTGAFVQCIGEFASRERFVFQPDLTWEEKYWRRKVL